MQVMNPFKPSPIPLGLEIQNNKSSLSQPQPPESGTSQAVDRFQSLSAAVLFGSDIPNLRPNDWRQAELTQYLAKTGFPDRKLTAARIETHAIEALQKAAADIGVEIYYSGYDRTCSIATGNALPGSDLDEWQVLISMPKKIQTGNLLQRWGQEFRNWLFPPTVDVSPKETFLDALQKHLDPDWIDSHHDGLPEVLLVPEVEAECKEYAYPKSPYTVSDNYDRVRDLFHSMAGGKPLIHAIPLKQQKRLEKAALYRKESKRVPPDLTATWPEKLKHSSRDKLCRMFPTLSEAEQYVIVQILKRDAHSAQNTDFMLLNAGNEYLPALESLEEKGLLIRLDPQSPEFLARKDAIIEKQDWSIQMYIGQFLRFPKMVAPWKPYYGDEVILTEMLEPELARKQDQLVQACRDNPNRLPKTLRHRLLKKLEPDKEALVQRILYGNKKTR